MPPRARPLAAACLAAVVVLTACGEHDDVARNDPGERRGPTEEGESRTAVVATSVLLLPLAERAADVVARPAGVDVELKTTESDVALARLCARKVHVALSNRKMNAADRAVCRENGVDPVRSLAGHHVVALYRHPELRIDCLTVDQLRRLWRSASEVERYSDLGPGLPAREVRLISYPPGSTAHDFFARTLTRDGRPLRADARSVADRLRLGREVRSTPDSLAFGPYTRAFDGERPQLVAVDGGRGCVKPSARTVQSGAYTPLSRPLFMYSTRQALAEPPVKEFVDYVLDAPREVAAYSGVVPPERPQRPEAEPR